jgi:ABC-type phosphate/phosphonate transport system substrate-binding protein
MLRAWSALVVLALAVAPWISTDIDRVRAQEIPDPDILRVGMLDSLVQDTSPRLREAFAPKFADLVKEFTGLKSVILPGLDAFTAARQLEAGKWHLGIFEGVEFAWVQRKFPKLRPLMVVIYEQQRICAVLVTKQDSDIKSAADLKGADLNILSSKLPCRLFANKLGGGRSHFKKLWQKSSGEDALDDILTGKVNAAIVDTAILDLYKDVTPGKYHRLKVLAQSVPFPEPAIIHREGILSTDILRRLEEGMNRATQSPKGREALTSFQIKRFAPVPPDYQQSLDAIAKAFPAPAQ